MTGNPLEDICHESLALLKAHATLFSLESKLAKQSIIPWMASLGIALLLGITLWITLLICIGYGLYLYTQEIALSLGGTFLIQCLLFLFILSLIRLYQQRMQFRETRAHLKDYWGEHHEHE